MKQKEFIQREILTFFKKTLPFKKFLTKKDIINGMRPLEEELKKRRRTKASKYSVRYYILAQVRELVEKGSLRADTYMGKEVFYLNSEYREESGKKELINLWK